MNEEPNKDEALKADESQIDVESPATEEVPEEVDSGAVTGTKDIPESNLKPEPEVPQETESRKTASSRIKELVIEKKEAEAKAESLAEQLRRTTAPQAPVYNPQPVADDDGTVSVEEVLRRADALAQIRVAQAENLNRVNNEALEAIRAYPQLDPDSESFDKDLSESISQATLAKVQVDPTASVKKFVEGLMRPYQRAVEKQAQGQAEVISKQASQQAMRPTQVQEQEKPFSELSIAEMEQRLEKVWH